MTWVDVEEENVMKAYIARHKDKNVLELLENAKKIGIQLLWSEASH